MKAKIFLQSTRRLFGVLLLCAVGSQTVSAHLMVAQKGTLNIKGNGAFVVLSIPVSSLAGGDDNGDGQLSRSELTQHHVSVAIDIKQRLLINDGNGRRELKDMLLTLAPEDHVHEGTTSQLIITGRFDLTEIGQDAKLYVNLFGESTVEQVLEIKAISSTTKQTQELSFSPKQQVHAISLSE